MDAKSPQLKYEIIALTFYLEHLYRLRGKAGAGCTIAMLDTIGIYESILKKKKITLNKG
jgi:hypothetical protein